MRPGEADDVRAFAPRRLQDALARHHHAEVDDLEVVALEHDADDVLADVVHVALHGRHDDLAVGALTPPRPSPASMNGIEVRDRLLHHARALHHLRQEHLAGAEQVADDVHAVHQRAFDHLQRPLELQPRLFGVLDDEVVDALDERVLEPLRDRQLAPLEVRLALARRPRPCSAPAISTSRSVASGRRLKHDVFDALAQVRLDLLVDRELAGVHDAHVHARR